MFYPPFLSQRQWFSYYTERLSALEVSATFYRMPSKELFDRWHKETPDDYVFTVKGPRFITHVKKLKDVESPLEAFFNASLPLQEKMKIVLWQFPPTFKADIPRLESFFKDLRPYTVRHAFEFRHDSWASKACVSLCERYGMALCMADSPEFADSLPPTTDFIYLRRHGEGGTYGGSYSPDQLRADADRIEEYLTRNMDVYCFFNNNAEGHAPVNAMDLRGLLGRSSGGRSRKS